MYKEIKYKDEVIRIDVNLNVDHSELSGILHDVVLSIPTYDEKKKYRVGITTTGGLIERSDKLIAHGKQIIDNNEFQLDTEVYLKKHGFKN